MLTENFPEIQKVIYLQLFKYMLVTVPGWVFVHLSPDLSQILTETWGPGSIWKRGESQVDFCGGGEGGGIKEQIARFQISRG